MEWTLKLIWKNKKNQYLTNSVHEQLRFRREVIIYNTVQLRNINPSCSYVCHEQNWNFAWLKLGCIYLPSRRMQIRIYKSVRDANFV